MYVGIYHQIRDAQDFWARVEKADESPPPSGMKALAFFPSTDSSLAFCLYEADSVESLRRYVDEGLGPSSSQTYFPVNPEVAAGIPA